MGQFIRWFFRVMTRDYKHRAQPSADGRRKKRKKHKKQSPVAFWKWLAAGALVAVFILFLVQLRSHTPTINKPGSVVQLPIEKEPAPEKKSDVKIAKPEDPSYEFYTILPEQGEMIPDYEVKKLKRAETLGKPPKPSSYILQAGSFRDFSQADKVKARLALLGVEAKIEVATVGNTHWNRVKLGPYPNMRSVDHVRSKLRKAGVETVVFREKQ